ncbi:Hpt protein [Denitrovibrio acetiphilus DSM 12809]|uniref:Hpt protein n=1 Tax=Denitrovibrio acetiphilus (strain DSM 12809 / NBRC 114555 / N2460) TaxID=522772 RepID=D4H5M5_DENA2|nr:Hpt domain-containing protein [Denitrovibrio acetiphilus]ADD69466.1 Hpt protein [Denitrovibrio acetiphilus DSM 12809]
MTQIKNYNLKKVGVEIGLDIDTMEMLLEEFINVMDEEILNLSRSVADSEPEFIKHYAHKMKGAAANMMVDELCALCSEMQNADKNDKALTTRLLTEIESCYGEFKSLIKH